MSLKRGNMRFLQLTIILLATAAAAYTQTTQPPPQKPGLESTDKSSNAKKAKTGEVTPPANPAAKKNVERPASVPAPKFDIANIDKSVDPCMDFYQFACGNWMKKNPIPPDYPVWVSFNEVYEYNLAVLHGILEKAGANDPKRSPVLQKIGDYYASCMDEAAINRKGDSPLKPEFDRIAAIKDKQQMLQVMAMEALEGQNPIFGFGAGPDLHNAEMTVAFIDQSGISLPDRDYYLKDDAATVAIRKAYVDHLTRMFALTGQTDQQAAQSADSVMKIETELAKASMDRTLRRDPKNRDHKMNITDIQ